MGGKLWGQYVFLISTFKLHPSSLQTEGRPMAHLAPPNDKFYIYHQVAGQLDIAQIPVWLALRVYAVLLQFQILFFFVHSLTKGITLFYIYLWAKPIVGDKYIYTKYTSRFRQKSDDFISLAKNEVTHE